MKHPLHLSRSLSVVFAVASTLMMGCPSSSSEQPAPDAANLSVDAPSKSASANNTSSNSTDSESASTNRTGTDSANAETASANETGTGGETLNNVSSESKPKNGMTNGMTNGAANGMTNGAANGMTNGAANGMTNGATNLGTSNVAGLENPALENPAMGNGSAEMPPDNAVMDNTAIANLSNTGGLEGGNNIFNNSAGTKATNGAATGANGTALQNPAAASANSAAGTGNPTGTNTIAPPPNNAVPMVANASPLPINLPQGNGTSTGSTSAPVEPPAPPPPAKPNYKVVTEEELALWRQAAEKLRTLAPGEHPAEYTVQPGDTLWDICDQFLDDPYWWPKLWTMNPDISNPNIIEPGQKLVFESSSGTEPPQLAVRDIGKAESIPIDSKFVTQSGGNTWHPWMEKANILLDASEIPTDPTIESYGSIIPPTAFTIATPGYLSSSSPDDVGKIVPAGESILISSKSRVAFGEMDNPPAAGERFIAVRRMPHVPGPTGWPIGGPDLYYYTAILGAVKNHKSGLTEFVVEDTPFDGAAPDDLLIPYKNIYQFIEPAQTGRTATVQAEVVATASSGGRMATLGTVVFLERDEGTTAPGDDIELYMPVAGIVGFDNPGSLDGHLAARARVLEVTEDSIAAVIIATKREVSIGARTWPEF